MSNRKWETFIACGDSHGDMLDPAADKAFKKFEGLFKAKHRIHGGDVFDFRALRNGASDEEKREGVQQDIDAGLSFLEWYKPHMLLWGNHDVRMPDKAKHGNILGQACRQWWDSIADAVQLMGADTRPYCKRKGVYEYGGRRWLHGFGGGIHAAYKHAQHYGNTVMFHVHCPTGPVPFSHFDGASGYSCGSLCRLDMEYNRSHLNTLRQKHGWLYGWARGDESYIFHGQIMPNGEPLPPVEFKP